MLAPVRLMVLRKAEPPDRVNPLAEVAPEMMPLRLTMPTFPVAELRFGVIVRVCPFRAILDEIEKVLVVVVDEVLLNSVQVWVAPSFRLATLTVLVPES